ncbi:MAG TPA: cystathionine beta-lyase [Anaerolineae bacterium]
MNESTRIIHQGDAHEEYQGAVNPPVYHASLFTFKTYRDFLAASANRYNQPFYNRDYNPTVSLLEQKIADLEQADAAIAFSSGMGSITAALLALLSQGDHLLISESIYGPTRQFCRHTLSRLGVEAEFFPPAGAPNLAERLRPNTRLIYVESPGSLTFEVLDLRAIAELGQAHGVATLADNSWATPIFQKPITLGFDVVVHSGTKYIAGHSDLTLGLLACSEAMYEKIKPMAVLLGACLAPDDAYLALRGLRTLPLRMAQHQDSAMKIARWLQGRPEVREVMYPGLSDFPGHALAQDQQTGFSSLFSFRLQPGSDAARHAFVDTLELFLIGVSWGGFESLMLPLETSYKDEPEWRARRNLGDDTFRTSIGLEDPDDLIADLEKGLAAWRAAMD